MSADAADKCAHCRGSICCSYVTSALDTPRSKADFQHLLWQVSHANVEIYKEKQGWYLLVNGRCEHLQGDGRCAIYEQRPAICREYDNDFCEFDAPAEEGFELHFRNHAEMLVYLRRRFRRWDG